MRIQLPVPRLGLLWNRHFKFNKEAIARRKVFLPFYLKKLCVNSFILTICSVLDDSPNDKSPRNRPLKCRKCEQSYKLKSSLISHSKYSCGTEPQFSCTQCGHKFTRKDNLQTHLIKIHKIDRKQLDQHRAGIK